MRTTMQAAAATLAAIVIVVPGVATASDPDPTQPQVRLKGAFGTVVGGPDDEPATAYPGMPLDAFIRSAPLMLELEAPYDDVTSVDVEAQPADGGPAVALSTGATVFAGPDHVGTSVVTATVEIDGSGRSAHSWLVEVPARTGGEEALLEIVPPEIELVSQAGTTSGRIGDGCYAYLCSDAGDPRPTAGVEPLAVEVGETLIARTADGSGLSGYIGFLEPFGPTPGPPREAKRERIEAVADQLALTGLEIASSGEWLLRLRVDFDRERGWLWHVYRLVAR